MTEQEEWIWKAFRHRRSGCLTTNRFDSALPSNRPDDYEEIEVVTASRALTAESRVQELEGERREQDRLIADLHARLGE